MLGKERLLGLRFFHKLECLGKQFMIPNLKHLISEALVVSDVFRELQSLEHLFHFFLVGLEFQILG